MFVGKKYIYIKLFGKAKVKIKADSKNVLNHIRYMQRVRKSTLMRAIKMVCGISKKRKPRGKRKSNFP